MRLRTIVIICVVLAMLAVAFIGCRASQTKLSEAEAAAPPPPGGTAAGRPEGGGGAGTAPAPEGAMAKQEAPAGETN